MKSRTSFFDKTAFRKDVTRFAPAWGLYSVGLVLILTALWLNDSMPYRNSCNIAELIPVTAVANLCYAFLSAQLLFGDLFNSRLCNALHAMPLKRKTWFGSHVAAGMCFSIIPNLGAVALAWVMMDFSAGWPVMLWWLLAATLQYLCFFGIAVLAMMLSGNRQASALIYGLMNFLSLLVLWLLDSLYEPLLPGVRINKDPFTYFSPVVWMASDRDLIVVEGERIYDLLGNLREWKVLGLSQYGPSWAVLAAFALVGAVLLGVSLVLYQKRDLECAGDFTAFKKTDPVLAVVMTIAVGVFFQLFADANGFGFASYLFLVAGMVVGYFVALMLLQRTSRVFQPRAIITLALICAAFLGTLGLTMLDPLGITRWVPREDEVVSVNLSTRGDYHYYSQGELDITDPEQIRDMLKIHSYATQEARGEYFQEPGFVYDVALCLEYTLENGRTRTRFYEIPADSDMGQLLERYYSSFEYVTGYKESEIPMLAESLISVQSYNVRADAGDNWELLQKIDPEALLRAIAADCAAGTLAQESAYHMTVDAQGDYDWGESTGVELGFHLNPEDPDVYISLTVYEDSENILAWLVENEFFDPAEQKY